MYQTLFVTLMSTMQGALDGVAEMVSGVAVALAVCVSAFKVVQVAWQSSGDNAIEQIKAIAKHQAGIVLVIITLAYPFPGLPGGVIGSFPSMMIKAGFVTANAFTSNLPAEFRLPFDQLGKGVDATIKKIKHAPLDGYSKEFGKHYEALRVAENKADATGGEWMLTIKKLVLQLVLAVCLACIFTILFFWCPPLLVCLYGASWLCAGILASWITYPGMQIAVDPLVKFATWIGDYIICWATDFIFYTIIYFSFALMMISFAIRATIFCVTAPFSVITVPFDSKRRVFFEMLWRAVALALTPLTISIVMAICVNAYSLLISSGALNAIREQYVGGVISPETVINWNFLGHFCDYVLRLAVYVLALPGLLALISMKAMWSAPRVVEELFGTGIGEVSARIPGVGQAASVATRAAT